MTPHRVISGTVISGVLGMIAGLLLVAAGHVAAEPLKQRGRPTPLDRASGAPEIVDRVVRPAQPAVPNQPAFFEGLTKDTKNGRLGAAGWTAPSVPNGARGAADPEHSGVLGGGFAAEWR